MVHRTHLGRNENFGGNLINPTGRMKIINASTLLYCPFDDVMNCETNYSLQAIVWFDVTINTICALRMI